MCTLLGVLGGLFLVAWMGFAFVLWRREEEASHRHKAQLRLCGTEELFSQAWNWRSFTRHADLPAVKEFRALLEQRRYGEMLEGWRALTASLFALEEHVSADRPHLYDSDSFRGLRDYVEVLHERQLRGE